MAAKQVSTTQLVGHFLHSVNAAGRIEWQGMVVGNPEPGWYIIQLFDYILGHPSVRRLVRIDDMAGWLFYPDADAMNYSYEHGTARAGGPYRPSPVADAKEPLRAISAGELLREAQTETEKE